MQKQPSRKKHLFSIAPEVSSYEFKEPREMKVDGTMVGFSMQYQGDIFRVRESMPVQVRTRLSYMYGGSLDYEDSVGYKQSGDVTQRVFDFAFAIGTEAGLSENFSLAPYLGYGFRSFTDDDYMERNVMTSHVMESERTYSASYLMLGADWKLFPARAWKLSLNTELDLLMSGENQIRFDDDEYYMRDKDEYVYVKQDGGYGLKFALKVERDFGAMRIFAEPFYRYWSIEKSRTERDYFYDRRTNQPIDYEFQFPKNRTEEFGLRIGVTF
ncbi:MAG: hypothetical protein LBQ75_09945 [Zoogloeaceae bacterium]|nr:hypothetical protein [Zoogloeaceae bacterium]